MNPSPYQPTFTSAHGRARIVKVLLIVGAVASGVAVLVGALSLAFPFTEGEEVDNNPFGAVVLLLLLLVTVVHTAIYFATVVFFLMWLYRTNNNLRAFNPSRSIEYSGGWAVGSFFIPFAHLILPYRAVKEVWQKSAPPEEAIFSELSPPAIFPIWWTFWLLSNFASNASFRLSISDNVDASTVTIVSMVANGLSIVAAVFVYLVVDSIDKRQAETSAKLRLGNFPQPPPPPPNLSSAAAPAPGPNYSQPG